MQHSDSVRRRLVSVDVSRGGWGGRTVRAWQSVVGRFPLHRGFREGPMSSVARTPQIPFLALSLAVAGWAMAGEGRTPVYEVPTVVTSPGAYVLTRDLLPAGPGPVIDIAYGAGTVEIDLNGFTCGPIRVWAPLDGLVVRNGSITGSGSPEFAIDAFNVKAAVIEEVTFRNLTWGALRLIGASNIAVRRNMVLGPVTYNAIEVQGGDAPTTGVIDENVVRGQSAAGIKVSQAAGLVIRANRLDDCAQGADSTGSLGVLSCRGCVVEANTVARSRGQGIYLENAPGTLVANNTVHEGMGNGIIVAGLSDHARLIGNVVTRSFNTGIQINSNYVHLESNVCGGNRGPGIMFLPGSIFGTYGRNTLRGNSSGGYPCLSTPPGCSINELCDDGFQNSSFGDNMAPNKGC